MNEQLKNIALLAEQELERIKRSEQLKQAIKEIFPFSEDDRFKGQGMVNHYKLMGAVDALNTPSILRHADPEIMKQAGWVREEEWISVEDRLPENANKVIVYTNYKRIVLTSLEKPFGWDTYPLNFEDEIITHWIPIPQPPKQ